jgi:hypothetical protein
LSLYQYLNAKLKCFPEKDTRRPGDSAFEIRPYRSEEE